MFLLFNATKKKNKTNFTKPAFVTRENNKIKENKFKESKTNGRGNRIKKIINTRSSPPLKVELFIYFFSTQLFFSL